MGAQCRFKDKKFRRLAGVQRATFAKIVTILKEGEKKQKASGENVIV